MDSKKKGTAKGAFTVLKICTEVIVTAERDRQLQEEEVDDADLTLQMGGLSLTGNNKLDHCVPKLSGEIACGAHNARGKLSTLYVGTEASVQLDFAAEGKNISTGVSVTADASELTASSGSGVPSWLDLSAQGTKQKVEIPLRTIFLLVLDSVGINDPIFTKVKFIDACQVHIEFDSVLPCSRMPPLKNHIVSGDVCPNFELAEESAIKKAFDHLEYMHNLVVLDLSSHKMDLLKFTCRSEYMQLLEGTSCVENMLQRWSACCDLMYRAKNVSNNNSQITGITGKAESYLGNFRKVVDAMNRGSMGHIREFGGKLKLLKGEKNKYQEESRSKPYTGSKYFSVHGNVYPVDILKFLLD